MNIEILNLNDVNEGLECIWIDFERYLDDTESDNLNQNNHLNGIIMNDYVLPFVSYLLHSKKLLWPRSPNSNE